MSAGILDEKAAAAAALGTYAEELGAASAPYIEGVLSALLALVGYFHEIVRAAALDAVPQVLQATQAAFPSAPGASDNKKLEWKIMLALHA